jgi:hypothetical protein
MLKAVRNEMYQPDDESKEAKLGRMRHVFGLFGNAVVRRALESLGFQPEGAQRWSDARDVLRIDQQIDGVWLTRGDGTRLEIQTVLLEAAPERAALQQRVRALPLERPGLSRVFLCVDPQGQGNASVLDDELSIAAIGPHDLTSVERVGHLLWRWLAEDAVERSAEWFQRNCPMCSRTVEPEPWENGGFRSRCKPCETVWEARVCDSARCGRPFPVLRVPDDVWSDDLQSSRDWWARPYEGRYQCTHCWQ